MKRHICIVLLLVLILMSTIAFAAPGDIIHTGLNKVYRKDIDNALLVDDVLNPNVAKNKFFREIEVNGSVKFVNIVEEEKAHEEYIISNLPEDLDLTDEEAVKKYILSQTDKLEEITRNIAKDFEDIGAGITYEEYLAYHNTPILKTPDNYSTPIPGSREGSAKIAKLNLPTGANKWKIQITDSEVPAMKKDTELKDGIDYVSGRDINIEVGQYLVLYAVDNNNRIKAYANIKIEEEMINTPKEPAEKIEVGEISEGEKFAGAVVIKGLDGKLSEGVKWQVFISNTPIEKVYKIKMTGAIDYALGDDIVIASEDELHPIADGFKKLLVLLEVNDEGIVQGYNSFEIDKDKLSKAPTRLAEGTHYKGPMPGNEDGTTKFTDLHFGLSPDENMKDAKSWKVLVSKEPINVPKLNSGTAGTVLLVPNDIEANIGDYLLLAAVDASDKIKGYKIFHLNENMIKGQTAPKLPSENYSKPEKGSVQGTTRIDELNLTGIEDATKWMYKIGENLVDPILNKIVDGSSDYIAGQNIRANVGDDFLLLATDEDGKVKAFAKIDLKEDMIKDPPPVLLRQGVNYVGPMKGSDEGTTRFESLVVSNSIEGTTQWMYKIYDEEPEIPELNNDVDGAIEFDAGNDIGENLIPGKYLLLLATDDSNLVKGYAIFRLNEYHIRMPDASPLEIGKHYSKPEKGTAPGTTRITELKNTGIEGVEQWRIKISGEAFLKTEETIELNSIIPQTSTYRVGNNIRAEAEDWLLLLATDYSGRVKGYTQIQLTETNVRKPNALSLILGTNYTEPEAGTVENSTRFGFLDFSTNVVGATKWMYKIGDKSFGDIELDSVIEDALPVEDEIVGVSDGDYLLLLAANDKGEIKAYREFRLTERNIRGGDARVLNEDNYSIEKGNKPGTTRFSKLLPLGMEGSIRWKYKLMDSPLPDNEKPYLNSVIEDTDFINIGQDIGVKEIDGKYGYLLLLATDYSGRTKGYVEIEITSAMVKEHAAIWNVELKEGSAVDSVKITGIQPDTTTAKYIIGYREFSKPAVDEVLDVGIPYELEKDILQVRIGDYIGIYAVDKDNKIKAFNSFEVTADNIKQGSALIKDATILEGSINNGGEKIIITLEDAEWANDLKTNADKRQTLYNGFKVDSEAREWSKVVASLIKDGSGAIDVESSILTISLPETKDYDITKDQKITLTVPAIAIENAINPIEANGSITIKPTIKATISGDVVSSIVREKDIKAGGKTIVVELMDGDWVGDVDSDALIGGFGVVGKDDKTSTNWSKIAREIKPENIVRNSSKKLTITLPSIGDAVGINFGVDKEIISLTIPASLVQGAEKDTNIVATPTFILYPDVLQVAGETIEDTVKLEAPDGRVPRDGMDTWKVKVTAGTLRENITDRDIVVSGLPRGLRTNVEKIDDKIIGIKVSGTATTKFENMEVQIRIKGTAVEEPNSLDSEDIKLKLSLSEDMMSELEEVQYDLREEENKLNLYLTCLDEKIEYSINSTDGINGTWDKASSGTNGILICEAKPMKIWVREKAQPKVVHLVGDLEYADAPVDVKISEYIYSETGLNAILEGNTTGLEYSTDGGKTWTNIDSKIELGTDSDLRIRKAAVSGLSGKLPSNMTKKLNGLYLGNVELNVAEGVITGTNTNMEYSSDGEKYTQARNGDTTVSFVKGTTIWVRERINEINKKELGKVGQMEFSKEELDNIEYDISGKKMALKDSSRFDFGLNNLQYKIANDPWKDVGKGTGIEFKAGSLQFRKKGTDINLPSEARKKTTINPPEPAPNLNYDDTNHTIEKIGTDEGAIYEYSINNGSWTLGNTKPTFEAGNEVRIRIKATKDELASEIQTIKFTPNLDFSNVYLDAGKSIIINTTAEMEYSLNSTDGLDGQWYKASSPNTSIPLKKDMTAWIREARKPTNNRALTKEPMGEKEFTAENLEPINFSIVNQTISIYTQSKDVLKLQNIVDNLQYRNGDNWINIDYTKLEADKINILAYNVEFKPGKLEFRLKGDKDYLPSKPVEKVTIKASASAPTVEVDHVENKVVSINAIRRDGDWDKFEYNIDNGPWISGRYLKTEDLSGEKILRIRKKATNNELPSQETVIEFKEKLPLEHVRLSTHVTPLELNGTTTEMEYRVNNVEWKKCDNGNTKLTRMDGSNLNDLKDVFIIEIRDSNQHENVWIVYGTKGTVLLVPLFLCPTFVFSPSPWDKENRPFPDLFQWVCSTCCPTILLMPYLLYFCLIL